MTTAAPRRRAGRRISAALWGLLVIGAGILSIVAYSGYEIDLELAAIILLAAVGGWMLLSAAVSGLGRKREAAAATAPVVEETTVKPTDQPSSTAGDLETVAADGAVDSEQDSGSQDGSREPAVPADDLEPERETDADGRNGGRAAR
ncbi:hypothetical protein [Demequina sp. NBRC 110053]|uniref:hypothetical protein n=1 Tax=Demequina sp. NBRC 110053 TaxID=1570342 RepID=UPI001186C8BF|nr:hypothetical protein [Demequina sp. NBRC 110053]